MFVSMPAHRWQNKVLIVWCRGYIMSTTFFQAPGMSKSYLSGNDMVCTVHIQKKCMLGTKCRYSCFLGETSDLRATNKPSMFSVLCRLWIIARYNGPTNKPSIVLVLCTDLGYSWIRSTHTMQPKMVGARFIHFLWSALSCSFMCHSIHSSEHHRPARGARIVDRTTQKWWNVN